MNILKAKWIFSKPSKQKYLIFDRNSTKAFNFLFKKKRFEILDRRGESINFFVLAYTILKDGFKNLKKHYFKNYIYLVDPKIVLSGIDNDFTFFLLKNLFPKPKYICVQRGIRNSQHFKNLKNFRKKNVLKVDFYLVFNSIYKKKISKFVYANFLEIGSIYNNLFFKKKKLKQIKDITFISQKKDSRPFKHEEKEVINLLINYCIQKNLKLNFFAKITSSYRKQLLYLKKFKNVKIIYNKDIQKNYDVINRSKMIVFLSSTLGYEAFAKGIKTVSISYISRKNNKSEFNPIEFGYPGKFKKKGFFWISNNNKKLFNKTLDNVYNCRPDKWLRIYKSNKKKIMEYDPGNKKLKNLISSITND